jgi:phospholipid/cholesterol/gamma-HCH transport system permease protein
MHSEQNNLLIVDDDINHFTISIADRLDMQSVSRLWNDVISIQKKHTPNKLIVDAKNISYCDGAGIALFCALKENQEKDNRQFELIGLQNDFYRLFESANQKSQDLREEPREKMPIRLGKWATSLVTDLKENIQFLGETVYCLFQSIRRPRLIRWKDTWHSIEDVGPNALPIIILIGFLMGLISAFQAAIPLGRFGAQLYIIDLVGISLVKELGPLMTAILLAGRTASSFSAEIGTMKINQEIDALSTMGLNPIRFLAIPRIIATMLMTPLLNVFLILFGLLGCWIVMHALGFSLSIYLAELKRSITLAQFIGGSLKAICFGVVIAGIGCLNGLKTQMGASSVGESTTRAVVNSIIMMILIDGVFAYIFYVLNI